ncbi:hypothetical protein AGDE_03952 [Angomonas deanei]|uniref:Alba, putative n=1 Tax=Angomonas deanei TaxID=59799 RepID=S9WLG6_9TRYP|nr:hypothetical protein AGDE_05771 [Angomonas deanei]EPY39976.1 hypothetical protein AGDE_03952 [Angomonas deanei]CAD2219528.1 Alba, putative [Angomonas deanei]|eukprot:EPY38160.1 hypothetical protein AGDE_05771 [Angomonas deanei]
MSSDSPVNVRVSAGKRKYAYVDFTKHRLHEGASEIVVSGLGSAIADAVSVVELLKNQGLVVVKKIRTSRGDVEEARSNYVDKIEITVAKTADFEAKYAEQQKAREEAAAAKEASA